MRSLLLLASVALLTLGCSGGEPKANTSSATGTSTVAGGGSPGSGGSSGVAGMGGMPGAGGNAGGNGGGTGGSGTTCDPNAPYPEGPYGNAVGQVVANLQLRGYRNDSGVGPTQDAPFVNFSLDDIRCQGHAVVHLSDYT